MSATDQQLSAICTNCGLCCDGTLYIVAPLTRTEYNNLIDVLEVLTEANGDTVLRFPCKALNGACCTMYDTRPQICRGYHCGVLDSVSEGSLDPEQAVQIVSQVRSLARSLETALAAFETAPATTLCQRLSNFYRRLQQLDPAQRQAVDPELLLAAGTLKIMLAKHYKVLELTPPTGALPSVAADERTP